MADAPAILVIDDDPDTSALIERFLTRAGYLAGTVNNAQAAFEAIQRRHPSLILMDACMPGMDGFELCARLHERLDPACPPVIFVTALGEEADKLRAFAAGGVDYLHKPVTGARLLALVKKHLETGARWSRVSQAASWDQGSLPQRFREFREGLLQRHALPPASLREVQRLRPHEIFELTRHLPLSEEELAREMARTFDTEYVPTVDPSTIQLEVLPRAYCQSKRVLAVQGANREEVFVTSNPFAWGLDEMDVLDQASRGKRRRLLITREAVLTNLLAGRASPARPEERTQAVPGALWSQEPGSAPSIVNSLVADAARSGASDLHIQATRDAVRVRYRIDGRMRPVATLDLQQHPSIVARIKVMCGMDIAESRKPQDGRCLLEVDGRDVEMRVSTLPATHGEKVVLRILAQSAALRRLDSVGFEPDMLRAFRRMLAARQGMILITGPTGSGKTTVLYAALAHLNEEETNILTVEDPVEMDLEGITQVQVHDRAGRSFATTLRSMLRQDPDVIMIGEIRDLETAEIACRASLTGHLVLSTLHTQDTLGTLVRLSDMGIPPYLVAASLNGVIAQRLVQKVCEDCAREHQPSAGLRVALEARFGHRPEARFRAGTGCDACRHTGRRGRVAVFELLTLDDDVRAMMVDGVAPRTIRQHVERQGFRTLEEDAYLKACEGVIPPEEILSLGLGLAASFAESGEETGKGI